MIHGTHIALSATGRACGRAAPMDKLKDLTPRLMLDKINEIITFLNRRNGAFKPPTAQDVEDYAKEYASTHKGVDGSISGDTFCDFYESKGWMIGKSKMKDWRASVRKCCREGWAKKIPKDRAMDEKKLERKTYEMKAQKRDRDDYTAWLKEQSPERLRKFCETHTHLIWLVNEVRPGVLSNKLNTNDRRANG